ncbi:hypothetical protein [Phytobacter diazotrophicus]|uniref:hypothetical protein n=1 Tax=Phytobacter diazotrophicus TaxID=395631 RepID=UPI002FF83853
MKKIMLIGLFISTMSTGEMAHAQALNSPEYLLKEICMNNGKLPESIEGPIKDGATPHIPGITTPNESLSKAADLAYKTYNAAPKKDRDECNSYSDEKLTEMVEKYGKK